jgi:H+/Cl- antiporter ClcA
MFGQESLLELLKLLVNLPVKTYWPGALVGVYFIAVGWILPLFLWFFDDRVHERLEGAANALMTSSLGMLNLMLVFMTPTAVSNYKDLVDRSLDLIFAHRRSQPAVIDTLIAAIIAHDVEVILFRSCFFLY